MRGSLRSLSMVAVLLASPLAAAQSTRFRLTDLDLRDPHVWVSVITCMDLTDSASIGINPQIQAGIQSDADGDGFLDQSTLLEFLPLDQALPGNLFAAGAADCTAPVATTSCGPIAVPVLGGNAALSTTTTCDAPLAGTTRPYAVGVASASAPCFGSPIGTLALDLGGVLVTLTDARISASFVGAPALAMTNGLMRGFLSETDANATIIPATIPFIGGRPLSSVLAGGTGACPAFSDKDTGPGGVVGWYFYLNFPAQKLNEDPFSQGFADGFE